MKQNEIMKLLQEGRPIVQGEFRRSKAEVIKWRDRQSQKAMEAPSLRHTIETKDETFEVSEFVELKTGEDAEKWAQAYKPAFQKGQNVIVLLRQWVQEKGLVKARGELYLVEQS